MTILYFSFQLGSKILHKKFQVIWSNIEGVVVLFVIIILTKISFFTHLRFQFQFCGI